MAIEEVISEIIASYTSLMSSVPVGFRSFISLFFVVVLMVAYSAFIWRLHKFIGHKNIFELNLNQYNRSKHPVYIKVIAALFYFLEYLIILPILIMFWFAIFTIFLILVMDLELKIILFVSAAVIATIRVAAYIPRYGEVLAREIGKLLPFNLLAITLLTPNFFNVERIIGNISTVGEFFSLILNYLFFIIVLEIVLRFFEFVLDIVGIKDISEKETEDN